ncbi:MAG: hypothetical protein HDT43_08960 [Ruminococcaceae bacterium]|nr:hypothetical protein [Oscillospiraceae bacterium]
MKRPTPEQIEKLKHLITEEELIAFAESAAQEETAFPKDALCAICGVDFLVRRKRLPMLKRDLKNPRIRRFIEDFAIYFNHCAMFIGINDKGSPYISSGAVIHDPERSCVNGVNVVTEKGTFDIKDRKERALLRKLAYHYTNRRVALDYGGEAVSRKPLVRNVQGRSEFMSSCA